MNGAQRNVLKKSTRRLERINEDLLEIYTEEDIEMFWFHQNIQVSQTYNPEYEANEKLMLAMRCLSEACEHLNVVLFNSPID